MLRRIGWIVGIVLFVWATVSAFSIFSELKFLVDGWTWSVDQVPIFIKAIALAIARRVSDIVRGYREFVRGLARMLLLPRLPSWVYDTAGILAFSIGRGYRLSKLAEKRYEEARNRAFRDGKAPGEFRGSPLVSAAHRIGYYIEESAKPYILKIVPSWRQRAMLPTRPMSLMSVLVWASALTAVYGIVVLAIVGLLFGIDYAYRHFAL